MSDRLRELVANVLRIPEDAVTDDLEFNVTPTWDSVNHIGLILSLESEYNVMIPDEQVVELTTYRAICEYVDQLPAADSYGVV